MKTFNILQLAKSKEDLFMPDGSKITDYGITLIRDCHNREELDVDSSRCDACEAKHLPDIICNKTDCKTPDRIWVKDPCHCDNPVFNQSIAKLMEGVDLNTISYLGFFILNCKIDDLLLKHGIGISPLHSNEVYLKRLKDLRDNFKNNKTDNFTVSHFTLPETPDGVTHDLIVYHDDNDLCFFNNNNDENKISQTDGIEKLNKLQEHLQANIDMINKIRKTYFNKLVQRIMKGPNHGN